jgi:glycosyltransferase involved in cell wall biosynthesis
VAFHRGDEEYPSALEAASELAWTTRQLSAGLLDGVDVVHAAGWSWATPVLAYAARRRGLPLVRELTTTGDAGTDSLGGRFVRWTNRQAAQVIAISPALAEAVRAYLPAATPVWCRPNGVDTARFHLPNAAERASQRAQFRQWFPDLADSDTVVLQVGRIRPLKNQIFLADCVARLPAHFRLLQIGPIYGSDDAYAASLRRRLAEADLAGRAVLIEGNIGGIENFMYGADLLAMPSRSEGFGTVMAEALCCGLPVVASLLPQVTDRVVSEGKNGFLSPLDRARFSEQIGKAITLSSERAAISAAAIAKYDQRETDQGYRQVFEQWAENRG